jgi:hypothetical protein
MPWMMSVEWPLADALQAEKTRETEHVAGEQQKDHDLYSH